MLFAECLAYVTPTRGLVIRAFSITGISADSYPRPRGLVTEILSLATKFNITIPALLTLFYGRCCALAPDLDHLRLALVALAL